jgi:hypothetical protein
MTNGSATRSLNYLRIREQFEELMRIDEIDQNILVCPYEFSPEKAAFYTMLAVIIYLRIAHSGS